MIVITFLSISFLVPMASTSTSGHSKPEPAIVLQYNDSIYAFHIPDCDPKAEIIFFHDIEWEVCEEPHIQTWMSSTKPPVCWPKALLSKEYPEARILSARYDAGNWKGETTGHMKLHLLANNLRQDILSIYKNSCPVFMVGHGLGGLVIKALIREVQRNRDDLARDGSSHEKKVTKSDCFLQNVRGVLYYATPFLGTKLADIRRDLPNSVSMWDCFLENVNGVLYYASPWLSTKLAHIRRVLPKSGAMLVTLEVLNSDICDLNEWFRKWRSAKNCKATSILANLPTNIPWYGHVVEEARHVVEEGSARYDVDDLYTSQTNHLTVCKPPNKTDSSFGRLLELIGQNVQAIAQGPVTHVGYSEDGSDCTKLVNDILEGLKTLGVGQGLHLKKDNLEKIDKFPKLCGNLRDGLREAGFAKTDENADVESWEPVYRHY